MFILFPAFLLVKTIDSYLHEFCARGNMAQRQKARYRVARYVIETTSQQQRLNQRRRTHRPLSAKTV